MKVCSAALLAQYAPLPGIPRKAASDETATTWPWSRATILGSAAATVTQAAPALTSMIFLTVAQSILRAEVGPPTPALAMTMSRSPADWIAFTSAPVSWTSSGTGTMFSLSRASFSSSSLRRAAAKTFAPSFA